MVCEVLEVVVLLERQKVAVVVPGRSHMSNLIPQFLPSLDSEAILQVVIASSRNPEFSISISSSLTFSLAAIRGPLSVLNPTAASASFCVYGSSFNALSLQIHQLPFLPKNIELTVSYAYSLSYAPPNYAHSRTISHTQYNRTLPVQVDLQRLWCSCGPRGV